MLKKRAVSKPGVVVLPVPAAAEPSPGENIEPQVRDLRRLHEFSSRMAAAREVGAMLRDVLNSALAVNGARQGVIFLPDEERDGIRAELCVGLDEAFLKNVEFLPKGIGASGAAYAERRRVVVADTESDPRFKSHREVARRAGFRAVHSTPLITCEGRLIAVLTIFFPAPHLVSEREQRLIDLYARQAADLVEGAQLRERLERELAQREASDHALRRSEERLRLALASGKVGVWDWDIVRNRVTGSESLYHIHGVSREEFDGTVEGFLRLIHPEDRSNVQDRIAQALAGREPEGMEFRAVRPDGGVIWLFANATVTREDNRPVRMIGSMLDITALHQADEALRARERQMQMISDLVPSLISYVGVDFRYRFCNRAYEYWFGVPSASIVGKSMKEVLGEAAWDRVRPLLERVLTGEAVDEEMEVPYSTGPRSVHLIYTPHRDLENRIVGVIIIVSDITALRRKDSELRRLAAIVESSQDSILSKDLSGTITSWNSASERMYGYRADEMIGRNVTVLVPPDRSTEEPQILARVARGEQIEKYETVRLRKDGSRVDVLLTVSPVKESSGTVIGASTTAHDITDRKRTESALRASEERFRALANHAPVGIFLSAPDGGCLFVNDTWCRMTGRRPEQARGDGWSDALHPDDRERVLENWRMSIAEGKPSSSEFRFVRTDGRTVWVQGHAVNFQDKDRFTGYLGTCVDITERKEAELDGAFLQRLSETLGAITAHHELVRTGAAAIGEFLNVDRAYFFEIDSSDECGSVRDDWHRSDLQSLAGTYPLEEYGTPALRDLLRSPHSRVPDVNAHLATQPGAKPFADLAIRSFASSAYSQHGRWIVTLAVTSRVERDWTDRECALLENAAARIWPMVQQARATEALRESEQLYRMLGDTINYGFWICDASGANQFSSASFLKLVGRTAEECAGEGWMDLLHPDDREATQAAWSECVRTGGFWEREHRFKGADGRWHPVLARGVPIRDAQGTIVRYAGINLDIAALQHAMATAQQRMAALEVLNETGSVLAADHDAARIVQTVAHASRELTRASWSTFFLNADSGSGRTCPLPTVSGIARESLAGFPSPDAFDRVFHHGQIVRISGTPMGEGKHVARSCLGVPVRSRSGRVLGALFLGHESENFFTLEGGTVIAALAAQAAVAIDNANLYAAFQRELAVMNSLHALSTRLISAVDVHDVADELLSASLALMGTDRGIVQLFEPATGILKIVSHRGLQQDFVDYFSETRIEEWNQLGRASLEGVRSVVEDVDEHELFRPHREVFHRAGIRATQSTPLLGREGRLLGLVTTHYAEPCRPEERDLKLLDLFAAHASGFIERSRSQELVRAREQQLLLVTDHAPIYLAQCDANYRFKFVNRTMAERYKLPREQILGRTVPEISGAEAFSVFKHQMDAALAGKRVEFEEEIPYSTLGRRWVHVLYEPERDAEGKVIGLVAVIVDITSRKHAERELERARDEAVAASRAKDDFLAALSHELRTPLSPVLLLASDSANNPALPSDIRATFDMIRANVSLEARLIDDLLDLTRITRGKMSLEKQLIDVHDVLREGIGGVQMDATQKRQRLKISYGATQTLVLGDPVRLQQVFWNILKNAVKFTPEDGEITVSTRIDAENNLVAEITDTGMGMTPEEIARAFDAFAQGDHASPSGPHRFGGLGLGLAISQKLMEMHEGRISAASKGRHCGSTFTIELPLAPMTTNTIGFRRESTHIPFTNSAEAGDAPRVRLLLVEDHPATRSTLEKLLTRRNFEVLSAATAAEARAIAASTTFDLVVSDVGLPDGDGYQLMRELRTATPSLAGIALSGYGMEDDLRRSQEAGFSAHLVKPVSMGALERAIMSLVRK